MPRNETKAEKTFYRDLGRNILMTRTAIGRTQIETADHVEVSFQQLQKWEKGENRIPVRELALISNYLGAPLSDLIGLENVSPANSPLAGLLSKIPDKEFHEVLRAWAVIKDPRTKRAIVDFVKALAALE